jgi:thioredoxin-dependent peroxiredoxin
MRGEGLVAVQPGGENVRGRSLLARAAIAATALASVVVPTGAVSAGVAALAPGDLAPSFALMGSDGATYRLADYRGKQAVVVAWFAKAFTGG